MLQRYFFFLRESTELGHSSSYKIARAVSEDSYQPVPSLIRVFARHIVDSQVSIVSSSGCEDSDQPARML